MNFPESRILESIARYFFPIKAKFVSIPFNQKFSVTMEQSEYLSPNDETWEKCSHPPLGLRGMPTGEMVPEFALTGVVDGIPVSCKAYQKELLELGVFIQPGT